MLFAYGATEPEAGSDLGALKTRSPCRSRTTAGRYRISGVKQWISNGGVADLYTILALAPGGPSWFVVDEGADGFTHGHHEDKHGIRLEQHRVAVPRQGLRRRRPADRRRRGPGPRAGPAGVRLHAADGGGVRAGRRLGGARTARSPTRRKRIQAGGPLSEKEGYTHKLIVPHAVALEAARATIEETAERIDAGEGALNIEGAIAKYLATEAGDAAADAAIQAHGGYGYTHDYMVEKIKRDVRITTDLRGHLRDHGDDDRARALAGAPQDRRRLLPRAARASSKRSTPSDPAVGADIAALAHPRAGRAARAVPRRPADPPPARAAAPRRADRPGRGGRGARPARAARGAKQLHPKAVAEPPRPSALAAASRVYARGAALTVATEAHPPGGRSRRRRARRPRAAPRPRRRSIAPRAACSPTCRRVADALYARKRR